MSDASESTTPTSAQDSAGKTAVDKFGAIETLGIDYIEPAQRHGRPRELFTIWMGSNIAYIFILVGGLLPLLGLSILQSLAVLLVGNLFWALVGFLAVSGPATGSASVVVQRAQYGMRGNRILGAGVGWVTSIAYIAINLAVGTFAGLAFLALVNVGDSTALTIVVAIVVGIATFVIAVYGHATIARLSTWFSAVLGIGALLLGFFVLQKASFAPSEFVPLEGVELWVMVSIGFTAVAALPLSWPTGADYARYLPASTSKFATAAWTGLGGFVAAVVLGGIGVLAGSVVDMSDPQTSLQEIVPAWFYVVFLLILVVGSIANNSLTAYSSGLAFQAMGIRWSRARSVIFDAFIGTVIALIALLSDSFYSSLSTLLTLTVAYLGPSITIYAVDILMRRNRYDALGLHDDSPRSPFWFGGGVNWAGATAFILGTGAALLCVNTYVFVGPVANALGGIDLTAIVGPVVAGLSFFILTKITQGQPRGLGV